MQKELMIIAAATVLLAGCAGTGSASGDYPGYATDHRGELLRDRNGRCWRNADWRLEYALAECDPAAAGPAQRAAAAPEPEIESTSMPQTESKPPPEVAPEPFQPLSLTVTFPSAEYKLNGDARRALEDFWNQLPRDIVGQLRFQVLGQADPMGAEEANRHLSARRAGSVRDWLRQRGIEGAAITVEAVGAGESAPRCSEALPRGERIACLAPYRRAVLTAVATGGRP